MVSILQKIIYVCVFFVSDLLYICIYTYIKIIFYMCMYIYK